MTFLRFRIPTAWLLHAALASLLVCVALPARAQAYPTKNIELLVPFPPGAVENRVRLVTERMAKLLGKPIVIINRPGGGWRVASDQLIRSAPDGHTLGVVGPPNLVILPALDPKAGYDIRRDYSLLNLTYETPMVLAVNASTGVRTLTEFLKLARAKPGELNYGAPAGSSVYHLWFEVFKGTAGIELLHVPYKGVAPALLDLAAGRTHAAFGDSGLKPFVDQGKVVVLATTGPQRSAQFPDAPTIREAGVPFTATSWLGFGAPAGLPRAVATRLVDTFRQVLETPDVRQALIASGGEFVLSHGPEAMQTRVDEEYKQFSRFASLGLQIE